MAAKVVAPPPRPRIGITCDYLNPKTAAPFAKLAAGYVDSILVAGGLPVLIPPLKKDGYPELDAYLGMVSGIVFTGGADLDPRKWGQPLSQHTQAMLRNRRFLAARGWIVSFVIL